MINIWIELRDIGKCLDRITNGKVNEDNTTEERQEDEAVGLDTQQ